MCGIAGFVNADGRPADRAILERMTATLAHRGPDGDGYFLDGAAALGHRRLAIIDLAGGAQPMANEDGTIWVSYNGELYNEPELRRGLVAHGHVFRTDSDTEALVHLYEEHGPGFVSQLNGMFALALWDGPRQRLVLARDRMGQKPLYYADLSGGGIVFGSEPKALLVHPDVPRRLDPANLARYLFYEYVPAPGSIWHSLRKLTPGSVLVWDRGAVAQRPFWTAPAVEPSRESLPEAAERFWTAFRAAVARHRRADVPLGVFLSGGVDSSSVAAALVETEPAAGVHTFSIGFDDPSFDESVYFRAVARHLGTEHHERTFSSATVLDLLPQVAGWLDEPFGDASVLPTHLLSRFARESVTVVLGGDGADETLAGYPTFPAEFASRWYQRLPRPTRRVLAAVAARLPVDHRNFSFDFKLKQFLRGAAEPPALAHQRWLGSFSGGEIARLLVDFDVIGLDVEQELLGQTFGARGTNDALSRALGQYQTMYLPEDILFKVDRASMACGLEVRAPFLDAALVEMVAKLPSVYKCERGQTKRLLKRAAAGRLPAAVLRRSKKGFGIPVARWLRGPLSGLLGELLGPDRLRKQGLFRPEVVALLVEEHRAGVRDHRKPLWTLLMFQLWHDYWLGE